MLHGMRLYEDLPFGCIQLYFSTSLTKYGSFVIGRLTPRAPYEGCERNMFMYLGGTVGCADRMLGNDRKKIKHPTNPNEESRDKNHLKLFMRCVYS